MSTKAVCKSVLQQEETKICENPCHDISDALKMVEIFIEISSKLRM
jgi:hypothetical protein